ncbi:GNAT family N-acetyltransferase [Christensenella tenuis]|jgi:ribosomal protein S18 acetylase RimI-like enzyme|uniref:GNAT family N-acetyltransferase n=1 Tax=Christensenella tenuis TaxID=2763033 RepID=A0ABR7EH75_9FIRM|nr:GNAT family N-acetyltransferase [Christensenella tenuis]MBC5649106.1 GNAT family N-acetyltransferase [Christensenella tenuis]
MKKSQLKYFARLGAESFAEDPLYVSYIPRKTRRKKFLYHLMMVRLAVSNREDILVADKQGRGLCVFRSAAKKYSAGDFLRCVNTLPLMTGYLLPSMRILSFSNKLDTAVFGENTLLIEPVFVGPDYQGQGVATRLISEKMKELLEAGIPCGLMTQNGNNVGFYEKLGFRVIKKESAAPHGFHNYYMKAG